MLWFSRLTWELSPCPRSLPRSPDRAELAACETWARACGDRAKVAEAKLAQARAIVSTSEAMITHLWFEIARFRREKHGRSSERRARLVE